jgi:hypothetical protein
LNYLNQLSDEKEKKSSAQLRTERNPAAAGSSLPDQCLQQLAISGG